MLFAEEIAKGGLPAKGAGMPRNHLHPIKRLASVVAVVALAVPATSVADVDVRNPDSRDVATQPLDLRSPDARDARTPGVDLRSPDAMNAGKVQASHPAAPSAEPASSFDWTPVGIALATAAALATISGAVFAGRRRRLSRSGLTS
jgi:hypothetical protein